MNAAVGFREKFFIIYSVLVKKRSVFRILSNVFVTYLGDDKIFLLTTDKSI